MQQKFTKKLNNTHNWYWFIANCDGQITVTDDMLGLVVLPKIC